MTAPESTAIETPCVKICVMDSRTGLCFGCARRLEEIGEWSRMSAAERARIMSELPERLEALLDPDARE